MIEKGRWVTRIASRVSYELHIGAIPDGLCVLHRCDVAACINPEHLFLGTLIDNNLDMARKGRRRYGTSRGTSNGLSKLSVQQVRQIRDLRGMKQRDLGKMFGVSHATVGAILRGKTWRHLP